MKPKIEGHAIVFRTWRSPKPLSVDTRWTVRCPCNRDRYLASTASWAAALEIALLHGRTFHATHS